MGKCMFIAYPLIRNKQSWARLEEKKKLCKHFTNFETKKALIFIYLLKKLHDIQIHSQ